MASARNGKRTRPRAGLYVESSNHGTAHPLFSVCQDHGAFLYAIDSDRIKELSANDVGQIISTLTKIFIEKTFGNG